VSAAAIFVGHVVQMLGSKVRVTVRLRVRSLLCRWPSPHQNAHARNSLLFHRYSDHKHSQYHQYLPFKDQESANGGKRCTTKYSIFSTSDVHDWSCWPFAKFHGRDGDGLFTAPRKENSTTRRACTLFQIVMSFRCFVSCLQKMRLSSEQK